MRTKWILVMLHVSLHVIHHISIHRSDYSVYAFFFFFFFFTFCNLLYIWNFNKKKKQFHLQYNNKKKMHSKKGNVDRNAPQKSTIKMQFCLEIRSWMEPSQWHPHLFAGILYTLTFSYTTLWSSRSFFSATSILYTKTVLSTNHRINQNWSAY